MADLPTLPVTDDGNLPPLPLLLQWLAEVDASRQRRIRIPQWMPGNGCLPDLLALTRIHTIVAPRRPRQPNSFRWWGGAGSGPVQVLAGPHGRRGGPAHRGEVLADHPTAQTSARDRALRDRLGLARLEDAAAAVAGGPGADLGHLLGEYDREASASPPPVLARGSIPPEVEPRAWNPLPRARRCAVALPIPPSGAPWAVIDDLGARHPVQVVEGPLERECLTMAEFDALGHRRFRTLEDPVDESHWEVTERVLDNGRVRAEFDADASLRTLCLDGRFTAWTGPALIARRAGRALSGHPRSEVLEDGPIRARLATRFESEHGVLTRIVTLLAGEGILRLGWTWQGEDPVPEVVHPSAWRSQSLEVGYQLGGRSVAQGADLERPHGVELTGIHRCRLGGDRFTAGIALAFAHPRTLRCHDGTLALPVRDGLAYALGDPDGEAGDPVTWSQDLSVPARATTATARPAPLRWVAEGLVAAHWVRPLGDGRSLWCFAEHAGRAARLWLYPSDHSPAEHAHLVDVNGENLGRLPSTPERDGWRLDLAAWQPALIAW